ncbi:hypothetical protein [Bradyrhizobium murdochi]|uniref:hypothetical protein n=1 Tax=Bradyrhizobium murdochi TaxID=1038859 RepID=UPI00041CD145|nr:hypothetical protein [Bradyrhizobium murdochi]
MEVIQATSLLAVLQNPKIPDKYRGQTKDGSSDVQQGRKELPRIGPKSERGE